MDVIGSEDLIVQLLRRCFSSRDHLDWLVGEVCHTLRNDIPDSVEVLDEGLLSYTDIEAGVHNIISHVFNICQFPLQIFLDLLGVRTFFNCEHEAVCGSSHVHLQGSHLFSSPLFN